MHFDNVYWDSAWMRNDDRYPSILAIGDSWFWYPFPGGSLLNHLGPLVAPREHVTLAYGNNDAKAFDYVRGTCYRDITNALDLYGGKLSAVFISGGGNDFAGIKDLRPMLLDDCTACETAAACFRAPADVGSFGWLLGKVRAIYIALIDQIIGATWSTGVVDASGTPASATGVTKIFVHNYDYAPVSCKGIFGPDSSPWLTPPFRAAKVPAALRDSCIVFLTDTFTRMLVGLTERNPGKVFLIDSRGHWRRPTGPMSCIRPLEVSPGSQGAGDRRYANLALRYEQSAADPARGR